MFLLREQVNSFVHIILFLGRHGLAGGWTISLSGKYNTSIEKLSYFILVWVNCMIFIVQSSSLVTFIMMLHSSYTIVTMGRIFFPVGEYMKMNVVIENPIQICLYNIAADCLWTQWTYCTTRSIHLLVDTHVRNSLKVSISKYIRIKNYHPWLEDQKMHIGLKPKTIKNLTKF